VIGIEDNNTYLDENEIIRVGGRLNKSKTIHGIKKLDSSTGSVKFYDVNFSIRKVIEKYWPISGRNSARKTVHKCVACFRTKLLTYQLILGDLPTDRIEIQ